MNDNNRENIPDILHKYCDEGVVAALENESMMFSRPMDFNDPFEFLPSLAWWFDSLRDRPGFMEGLGDLDFDPKHYPPGVLISESASYWKREAAGDWFAASLSDAEHNVRMWAQYGADHTGIVLSLNFASPHLVKTKAKNHLFKVDYEQRSRSDVSKLTDKNLSQKEREEIMEKLSTTKGKDWEHEQEYRWLYHPELEVAGARTELRAGKMKAFIPLPHECIEKVTLGYFSSNSLLETVLRIKKQKGAKWQVMKTKLSLDSFAFEAEPVSE